MCGIVGYTGDQQAAPILLAGLEKLEYRGYDSAGLAVRDGERVPEVVKAKGRLRALAEKTDNGRAMRGNCGIGHTRWATHGEPSENNAHPHCTDDRSVVAVHNGIIENYQEIREKLIKNGYTFYSDTDTEVAVKLIDHYYKKGKIVPLLKESADRSKTVPDAFLSADYPEAAQAEAARFLAEYEGFDFDRGVLALSAHPFTTNLHNHDVRITTHYQKRIDSSIFSVLHETGHAIYEFGIRDDLTQTLVGQGTSMGMHECQSRFFENIVGRSHAFWKPIYGKVAQMFGSPLTETSLEDFLAAVNRTVPGLIRTEADELSYPLHVLVRYEIEKMLIEEDLEVEKLPQIWNDKYEEYLGVRPSTDREGVLQDIHWSQGSIGYFPSYALGNAFGAQIYHQMKKELPVEKLLEAGNLGEIREYLRKNIHQYGKLKDSRQILRDMTGEDFNPSYYVAYLEEKYGRPEKEQ
jgi:carboxypeptidase Taq